MNRREFLQKLLDKADRGHEFVCTQLYDTTESLHRPPNVKRMQILQMGMGKIQLPASVVNEHPIEKQTSGQNQKVLVLQKVKSVSQRKRMLTNNKSLRNTCIPKAIETLIEKEKHFIKTPTCRTTKTQNNEKEEYQTTDTKPQSS